MANISSQKALRISKEAIAAAKSAIEAGQSVEGAQIYAAETAQKAINLIVAAEISDIMYDERYDARPEAVYETLKRESIEAYAEAVHEALEDATEQLEALAANRNASEQALAEAIAREQQVVSDANKVLLAKRAAETQKEKSGPVKTLFRYLPNASWFAIDAPEDATLKGFTLQKRIIKNEDSGKFEIQFYRNKPDGLKLVPDLVIADDAPCTMYSPTPLLTDEQVAEIFPQEPTAEPVVEFAGEVEDEAAVEPTVKEDLTVEAKLLDNVQAVVNSNAAKILELEKATTKKKGA